MDAVAKIAGVGHSLTRIISNCLSLAQLKHNNFEKIALTAVRL